MANINIDQLSNELVQAMREYIDDVTEAVDAKVEEVAEQVLKEIEATAPKHTGEYARTFTKTKLIKTFGSTRWVIWNKKNYRRVHLLEFGHAKVKGGRVAARPHMRPAYEKHGLHLPAHIRRIIERGGMN